MTDIDSAINRAVWFDIPVADLDRACAFYRAVLAIAVHKEKVNDVAFAVLEHHGGTGGCLVPAAEHPGAKTGILLYLNVDGRIRDAVRQTERFAGKVLEPTHPIGPRGFRAIVLDSEGNRIALHSPRDA